MSNDETTTATPDARRELQTMATARVFQYPQSISNALRNRGFEDTDTMTAAQAFDEFCNWHGLTGWGQTLREALDDARSAVEAAKPTPSMGRPAKMTATRRCPECNRKPGRRQVSLGSNNPDREEMACDVLTCKTPTCSIGDMS